MGNTSCTRRPIISMGHTKIHNGWGETMRVGFIGVGAMGSRMAGRVIAAHHQGVLYGPAPGGTPPLQATRAQAAAAAGRPAGRRPPGVSRPTNNAPPEP